MERRPPPHMHRAAPTSPTSWKSAPSILQSVGSCEERRSQSLKLPAEGEGACTVSFGSCRSSTATAASVSPKLHTDARQRQHLRALAGGIRQPAGACGPPEQRGLVDGAGAAGAVIPDGELLPGPALQHRLPRRDAHLRKSSAPVSGRERERERTARRPGRQGGGRAS
eukprot:COSAG04_NODE_901_length_9547_cov_3.066469_5_plen_168_part_00